MDTAEQADELIKQANAFYSQRQYEEAIERYRRAMALMPDSPIYAAYNFVVGEMLFEMGRYQEAIAVYRDVVERTPGHDQPWFDLGQCLMLTGQNQQAVQAFERCLELAPETAQALYYNALVHARLGHEEQARHYLQQAIRLKPHWKKQARSEALLKPLLPQEKAWWHFWK